MSQPPTSDSSIHKLGHSVRPVTSSDEAETSHSRLVSVQPIAVEPQDVFHLRLGWNSGEVFALAYRDLRYDCPCAGCVNEHTGARMITRESIPSDIRVKGVHPVGRYALQFSWTDGHDTGIFHFDRLYDICLRAGKRLTEVQ